MKVPENWRRARGMYKLLNEVHFDGAQDLKRQVVEAGGRDRTADEAVVQFCAYVARVENWGPHSIAEHPFLGSFEASMDVTEELKGLNLKAIVGD